MSGKIKHDIIGIHFSLVKTCQEFELGNRGSRGGRLRLATLCAAIALGVAGIVGPTSWPAHAAKYDVSIENGDLSQSAFHDLTEQVGLAVAYHPLAPAEPLGILGFDIGIEITAVDIDEAEQFWTAIVDDPNSDLPSYLGFPKLHAQKGLPFGVDVGLVYSQVPSSNIGMWGGEVKWAILKGSLATPALALRGSYTTLFGVGNLDVSTYGVDLSISKGFGPFTPYAGIGQVAIKSSTDALSTGGVPLQDESASDTHGFIGAKLSFLMLSFVAEADFAAIPTYGLRLNLSF